MTTGIRKRHSKGCTARDGGRCRCSAGYEAWVYSKRDGKKIRKTFAREAEAKSWRADAQRALDQGVLRAPTRRTLARPRKPGLRGRARRDPQPVWPALQAIDPARLPAGA